MPKIYEYFGLVFLFYSSDHKPIYVHAKYNDCENKIEFVYANGKLIDLVVKKSNWKETIAGKRA